MAFFSLAILLTAPLAAASTLVSADFTAHGTLHLPVFHGLTVAPTAALIPDTDDLQFLLTAPRLDVCEYEKQYPELEAATVSVASHPLHSAVHCYALTEVRIELDPDGDHAGWLGFYPGSGARFEVASDSLRPRVISTLALHEEAASNEPDRPDRPFYLQRVIGDHFLLHAIGEAQYKGAGALKVTGPDLVIIAAENTTRQETHSRISNDGPLREREERWLYLAFEDALIEMRTATPLIIASREVSAAWDGRLSMTAAEGSAATRSGRYLATGHDGWIEGNFRGTLSPLSDERVRLAFDGEMRATSIPFEPGSTVSLVGGLSMLGLVAVVGGALVAAGGVFVVTRRRRSQSVLWAHSPWLRPDVVPAPPPGGDVYALRANEAALKAHEAADERQWLVAADLMERARLEADRPDLAYWHGRYLHQARIFKQSLEALDTASYGLDSGAPEYFAACCALEMLRQEAERVAEGAGGPDSMREFYALQDKGAYYLMRALERAQRSDIVMEIAGDAEFRELFWNANVQEAFDHACARLSIR